ncbi:glycosyltransferase family 2 protein [Solidesulfovibrio sp.]
MPHDFCYIQPGLKNELQALTFDEMLGHYLTHKRNYLLDEQTLAFYIRQIFNYPAFERSQTHLALLAHLLRKHTQLNPFAPQFLDLHMQLANETKFKLVSRMLARHPIAPDTAKAFDEAYAKDQFQTAFGILAAVLAKNPLHIAIANRLCEIAVIHDLDLDFVLKKTALPDEMRDLFLLRTAYLLSKHLKHDRAVNLFAQLDKAQPIAQEMVLNYLATSFAKTNAPDVAKRLVERSLALDPDQLPMHLYLDRLRSGPTVPVPIRPQPPISICIYTYNKADLLETTLQSVCASDIGNARIVVLINGCSDNSEAVFEAMKAAFPDRDLEKIVLPVNVGAPAARNYLVNHVLSQHRPEYIAFLDDDVELPPDWLPILASVMQEDALIGAVGCKVVNPDSKTIQYLFRDISIAKPGIFRLSLSSPLCNLDNGLYDVTRDTDTVMGCCHLIRAECFARVKNFDICFTPTQLDDVAFHLDLVLSGYRVVFTGSLACIHRRATGFAGRKIESYGNALGNDVKFYYRFYNALDTFARLQRERNARQHP